MKQQELEIGGQGGIRTHGELAPSAVFKTAALNHSATYPREAVFFALSARRLSGDERNFKSFYRCFVR